MLTITTAAFNELKKCKSEDEVLRIKVVAGGCSGFKYDMAIENKSSITEEDTILEFGEISVAIDNKSVVHLEDVTVDWVETLANRGFKFSNPKSTKSCGCGKSFSAE